MSASEPDDLHRLDVENERPAHRNVRLLLVESGGIGWAGLHSLLLKHPHYMVIDEARHGDDAIAKARRVQPDGILLADDLPDDPVVPLLERLREAAPQSWILVFGAGNDRETLTLLRYCGAGGYLAWRDVTVELLEVAFLVAQRRAWMDSANAILHGTDGRDREQPALTTRECEALELLVHGSSSEDVAKTLRLNVRTIRPVIRSLETKLGATQGWQGGWLAHDLGLEL